MAIGLECGIVLTVPGVGALALAGLLGVPLGKMLLFGVLLVIPTVAISVAIMSFLFNHGWWDEDRDEQEFLGSDDETTGVGHRPRAGQRKRRSPMRTGNDGAAGGVATKTAAVVSAETPLLLLFAPLLCFVGAHRHAARSWTPPTSHNPVVEFCPRR